MTRYLRGIVIVWVALRYGLDELVLNSFQRPWLSSLARLLSFDPRRVVFAHDAAVWVP